MLRDSVFVQTTDGDGDELQRYFDSILALEMHLKVGGFPETRLLEHHLYTCVVWSVAK